MHATDFPPARSVTVTQLGALIRYRARRMPLFLTAADSLHKSPLWQPCGVVASNVGSGQQVPMCRGISISYAGHSGMATRGVLVAFGMKTQALWSFSLCSGTCPTFGLRYSLSSSRAYRQPGASTWHPSSPSGTSAQSWRASR